MKLFFAALLVVAAHAAAPSQETYTGPFLEFEDADTTITAVKPSGTQDLEFQGCSTSATLGDPKACAMASDIITVAQQLSDDDSDSDEEITTNREAINAAYDKVVQTK